MKDSKFAAEYKNSVNSIPLPADYKSKILSALREQAKRLDSDDTDNSNKFEIIDTTETVTETEIKTEITPETRENETENTENIISIDSAKTKKLSAKKYFTIISGIAAAIVVVVGAILLFSLGNSAIPDTKDYNFTVASATNLANIKGAKLTFRDPSGNVVTDKDGNPVTAYTDENGNATVALPESGSYRAQVTLEGYIFYEAPAENGNIYISPVMDEDTYRAVLTWENECDLDAMLSVTHGEKKELLFYFNSKVYDEEGELIAALDTDSKTPGSPETITFNTTEDGIFRFSVGSYSSLANSDKTDLQRSGAQVTLYKGDRVVDTYALGPDSQGNAWCVLEIRDSQIQLVDSTYFIDAMLEVY